MAARFWRLVLACEIGCAMLVAAALAAAFSLGPLAALAIALALALLAPAALVAAAYIAAALSAARGGGSPHLACGARALLGETLDFNLAVLAMAAERAGTAEPAVSEPAPKERPARPLLLIHGILCNRCIWKPWLPHLRAAGFAPIRAVSLEPLLADIETHARRIERELRDLKRESNGAAVAIVTHSMGGLVARAALRSLGPSTIGRIVTIACPHHGTRFARWLDSPPTRQMAADSAWLRALNGTQEGAGPAACITSIYSLQDSLIVPPRSAALAGAQLHELRGPGHFGILSSHRTIAHVVAALAAA